MEQSRRDAVAGQAMDVPACAAAVIDRITELEQLMNAAAADQATLALELRGIRQAEARAQQRDAAKVGRSVAAEIGLARKESPHRGAQLLSLAWTLQRELPRTWEAFTAGKVSEYRVSLVVQETDCLTRTDKLRVDEALADKLPNLSNRGVITETRRLAYEIDPHSVVERNAKAVRDRGVTLRPAPDGMTRMSALLPVAQGVAAFAALNQAAVEARSAGDPRSKNQVMADTLVTRVTGQTQAEAVPVEVQLVITDLALFGLTDTPARVNGYGPVPTELARQLAATAAAHNLGWLRRLYVKPNSGDLVGMESKARRFSKGMKRFLTARDEICRTPWCGAPIQHADHVVPVHNGGRSSINNGQGLCERCNQIKEHPGWFARAKPDGTITLRTPTGHRYESRPPPLPHEHVPAAEHQDAPETGVDRGDSLLDQRLRALPFPIDLSFRTA